MPMGHAMAPIKEQRRQGSLTDGPEAAIALSNDGTSPFATETYGGVADGSLPYRGEG